MNDLQRAGTALDPFMTPASVAIVGASDDRRKIGGRPLHYLLNHGYSGDIFPVNPRGNRIQGLRSYQQIGDLPHAPDLAIVALPARLVLQSLQELAAIGTKAAVLFSAGFAEMGDDGVRLQQAISDIASASGMRIIGPNCLGIFNANIGMFATFSTSLEQNTPTGGSVAVASQSGAYASHLSMLATERRMPIGYWFSTGNECDVEVAECIQWLAERDDVKVIIAYAEGIRRGDRLREALATAHRNATTVVFIKVGRSDVGSEAARSHTASLTGSDAVFDCLCDQYGAYRAHDTEEALDVAYAACKGRIPGSRRTGLMTVSGGVGIHMADCADELGLAVTPMPTDAEQTLRQILPYAGTRNPVDVTAQVINEVALFQEFLDVTLDRGEYDIVVIYFTFVAAVADMIEPMATTLTRVTGKYPDRLIVLSIIAPDDIVQRYEQTGCLVIQDPWRAVRAAAALAQIGENFRRPALPPVSSNPVALTGSHANEYETKLLLQQFGINTSQELLVDTPSDVLAAGDSLGWPVVLKIVSADIEHKTEVGGVVVNVERQSAEAAATNMLNEVRRRRPQARIDGMLVAQSLQDGIEVIAGIVHDDCFGPVVVFGLGGVFVEVLKDLSFGLAPLDEIQANKMIDATRAGVLLEGFRGGVGADRAALVELLLNIGAFADRHRGHIQTMDLNPVLLMAPDQGAVVLDALLLTRDI